MKDTIEEQQLICTHCGENCQNNLVRDEDQVFCCEGCRMVFQLLDGNGLCSYYQLNQHPGTSRRITVREDKFGFLEDPKVAAGLIAFQNEEETHVRFHLPQIHCSSCLYLLEQLHRLQPGVLSSRVDFGAREVSIVFDHRQISLRALADLLTGIGYEPHISLRDWKQSPPKTGNGLVYQLGIAGFCFANIMLLSFPEYLGLDHTEPAIRRIFRYLNLLISLPVVFYCARPFYISAWKGLRHRFLNIDAPIVLAIGVTFVRSAWEVLSGNGSGYFDSLSGIVFFMLVGRVLQDRTYRQLSFDRDYRSYFPVAVTVVLQDKATGKEMETIKTMSDLRSGDSLRIFSGELIPADGILTRGKACIDYSFVTGESEPVDKQMGDLVYAGGRQTGPAIEVLVVKEVAQSYLTQLWNRGAKGPKKNTMEGDFSFVHPLSRYFTYIVLAIAAGAALYWRLQDPARIWNSVTAVLIVACPCALFLSSTFTNGNLLRMLGRNHFYLRNAEVIERIATADHIVFDKTGTLTETGRQELSYAGEPLSPEQQESIAALAAQSNHPLSRALAKHLSGKVTRTIRGFRETPGGGVEGYAGGQRIRLGSLTFLTGKQETRQAGTRIYVSIGHQLKGYYEMSNRYRDGLKDVVKALLEKLSLSVLSGDNSRERANLQELLGRDATLLFDQSPIAKSRYVQHLQRIGKRVIMIGDGLNDAGALQYSDVGIALTENVNNFTPASDAILQSGSLRKIPLLIRLCRAGKKIILASFVLSISYNLAGLSFAVSGRLSPMVAAILMPASSLTILLLTYGCSNLVARRLRL